VGTHGQCRASVTSAERKGSLSRSSMVGNLLLPITSSKRPLPRPSRSARIRHSQDGLLGELGSGEEKGKVTQGCTHRAELIRSRGGSR
jgi:hypothetical protein